MLPPDDFVNDRAALGMCAYISFKIATLQTGEEGKDQLPQGFDNVKLLAQDK
jgi:hypothetical protein